ncbi:hypothetical protein LAWI1_G005798 [Lachnellula willkommii]|uniref:N-acetyltransferase domain-containing protein n=1 Tax=Lachnellula willkommii TaxID=215461 RepID=A0A559M866_9HELO|nr:hypothetical protein LAWI1_G005798 [Lachnellula willkommii]
MACNNFVDFLKSEIDQIFRPLCIEWNGKTPDLIKALRPDKKLYQEALYIFYRNNRFVLHKGNGWTFGDMTKKAVLTFTKITIVVEDGMVLGTGFFTIGPLRFQASTARIWHATNIREVTLEQSCYYGRRIGKAVCASRVEMVIPWTPSCPRGRLSLDNGIATANSDLKATGKLSSIIGHSDGPREEFSYWFNQLQTQHPEPWDHWFWQADEEAQNRLDFHMTKQKDRFLGDTSARYLKIIDEETGEIISMARWHWYPDGYSYTQGIHWETHNAVEGRPWPKGMNVELHNWILVARDAEREHWQEKGQPCWILMHLVTRASQRGRGAASMLVEWGVERARKDGVPAYLEAGALAIPLYAKHGFRQIGDLLRIDLRGYGVDLDFVMAKMGFFPGVLAEVQAGKEAR